MQHRFVAKTLALSISLLSLPFVYAKEDKVQQLEEVVISGSKEGTSIKKTPSAINKINSVTLDEKKATFVGQLLNQTPGVYITDLGNGQHMTSIRYPITTTAVYQYLEDGIPIRPAGLFNHNAMYEINLEGIDSIEVLKGPASSLYGSNAAGGAVNFLTRAAGAKPQAMIGYQRSNQGFEKYDFGLSGSTQHHGLRLSGFVSDRTGGWQQYNNADRAGVTVRHDWEINPSTMLKTVATYNRLYTQMPGSIFRNDYETRPTFSYNTFTWRKAESSRLSTAVEGNWNDGGLSTITAYFRDNTTNQIPSFFIFQAQPNAASRSCINNPAATLLFNFCGRTTDQSFKSLGLDARHRQDFLNGKLRVIAGLNIESTDMQANEVNLGVTRNGNGVYTDYTPLTTRRDYTVNVKNQALYSQIEYAPVEKLNLVAGIRYDKITYDFNNKLTPSNTTGAPSQEKSYDSISPKLGLVWNFSTSTNFYANISRGFAPPEVSSQYGGSLQAPVLKPAIYNNIDAGLRFQSADKNWNADVGFYRLIGKDEIVSFSTAPGQSTPTNAGKTLHQGIEFGVSYRQPQWDAKVNGTFAEHKYKEYQASPTLNYSGKDMQKAPRWLVNTELGYKPTQNLRLSAEVQYLSTYYMNLANTVKYPGHTLLNLRASYKWGAAEIWASIMNVANKKYADDANSSYSGVGVYNPNTQDTFSVGAPRTFLIGLRYTLGAK